MPYITTEKTGWEYLAYKVAYERAYKMVNDREMEFPWGRSYITAEQAGWEYLAYKIAYSQIQPLKPVIIDTRTALNFLLKDKQWNDVRYNYKSNLQMHHGFCFSLFSCSSCHFLLSSSTLACSSAYSLHKEKRKRREKYGVPDRAILHTTRLFSYLLKEIALLFKSVFICWILRTSCHKISSFLLDSLHFRNKPGHNTCVKTRSHVDFLFLSPPGFKYYPFYHY